MRFRVNIKKGKQVISLKTTAVYLIDGDINTLLRKFQIKIVIYINIGFYRLHNKSITPRTCSMRLSRLCLQQEYLVLKHCHPPNDEWGRSKSQSRFHIFRAILDEFSNCLSKRKVLFYQLLNFPVAVSYRDLVILFLAMWRHMSCVSQVCVYRVIFK